MSKSAQRYKKTTIEGEDMKGANNHRITKTEKSDIRAVTTKQPIVPLNKKQKEYMDALQDEDCSAIVVTGVLGSSKTFLPSALAGDKLLTDKNFRVVIARPAEGKAKSVGYTKGDFNDKLSGWCAPITDTLKQRVGLGNYEAFLGNERIMLLPLEQVKGRSFDDCWIIADEFEDVDIDTAKSLTTRVGQRTKLILTGDIAQQDLKKYSGLQYILSVMKEFKLPITHIDFNSWEYCVRSETAKMFGMAYEAFDKKEAN